MKTSLKLCSVLSCLVCLMCLLEQAVGEVDVSAFISSRSEILQKKQQEYEARTKELREIPERFSARDRATTRVTSPMSTPVEECDCDDPNDVHNYAGNFLYDQSRKKIYRINPHCKCKSDTFLSPVEFTPTVTTDRDEESESGYKWDIRY
jgi:hypothetical protein